VAQKREHLLLAAADAVAAEVALVAAVAAGDDEAARFEVVQVIEARAQRHGAAAGDLAEVRAGVRGHALVDAASGRYAEDVGVRQSDPLWNPP
jgi:hypothetical protein